MRSIYISCVLATVLLMAVNANAAQSLKPSSCTDVSWLTPGQAPPFLYDVDQAKGSDNCQFHEFASQNFLSLLAGNSDIANWPTIDDIFKPTGSANCSNPSPLGTGLNPVLDMRQNPGFSPIAQAHGPALVDQAGRYIHYGVRVSPSLCNTTNSCQLYSSNCVSKAATSQSLRFSSGTTSSLGSATVKTAWKTLETCNLPDSPKTNCVKDNEDDYFWVNGTVGPFSPNDDSSRNVKLGLIAFHLAQKTPTHPEMIWATWEHVSNSPVCADSASSASAKQCSDPSKKAANGWTLFNENCTGAYCSANTPPTDASGNVISPQPISQICRENPCGAADNTLPVASSTTVSNQQDIAALNQAIRDKQDASNNVWQNYFLVGTLWTKNGEVPEVNPIGATCVECKATVNGVKVISLPTGNPPACTAPASCSAYNYDPSIGNERGSTLLANSAVESWDQWKTSGLQTNPGVGYNCFEGCHQDKNSGAYPYFANLDFVHIFIHALQGSGTASSCSVNMSTCPTQ